MLQTSTNSIANKEQQRMNIYDCKNIKELADFYSCNKRKFANVYNSKYDSPSKRTIIRLCSKELLALYQNNIGKLLYDSVYENEKNSICKMCKNSVMFLNFDKGYSKYCSKTCATRDYDRLSEKSKQIAIQKRTKTMKTRRETDPVWAEEYFQKLSEAAKKNNADPERRKQKSVWMKSRILSGEFTPHVTNSWTHWETEINGKKFRSSFEGIFYLYHKEFLKNDVLYESLRIPYTLENEQKIYIVDFVDHLSKTVYEIKPSTLIEENKNLVKQKALEVWAHNNKYKYVLITEKELEEYHKVLCLNGCEDKIINFFKTRYKWNLELE